MALEADEPRDGDPEVPARRRQDLETAAEEIVHVPEIVDALSVDRAGQGRPDRFGSRGGSPGPGTIARAEGDEARQRRLLIRRRAAHEVRQPTRLEDLASGSFGADQLPEFGDRQGGIRVERFDRRHNRVRPLELT